MDENIIGKNIKYLREMRGEKQSVIADKVKRSESTISEYENGKKKPKYSTLEILCEYFEVTVEEMLNSKLYEATLVDSKEIVKVDDVFEMFKIVFPLIETKQACKNSSFLQGLTMIKDMLNSISNGIYVEADVFNKAVDHLGEAAEKGIYEAYANIMWCIFFLWFQQYEDFKAIDKLQKRLMDGLVDRKEIINEMNKNDKKVAKMKLALIEDLDETINEIIEKLKSNNKWAPLGDYYLALRYINGIVNTEYSKEMNKIIGRQMMLALSKINNKYALNYIECCGI